MYVRIVPGLLLNFSQHLVRLRVVTGGTPGEDEPAVHALPHHFESLDYSYGVFEVIKARYLSDNGLIPGYAVFYQDCINRLAGATLCSCRSVGLWRAR